MKKLLILMSLFLISLLVACGSNNYAPKTTKVVSVSYVELVKNEMYYVPHRPSTPDLPPAYEKILVDHPDLEVFDVEIDLDDSSHNTVSGYFIFTKEKKE